jgi:hypothetical protein
MRVRFGLISRVFLDYSVLSLTLSLFQIDDLILVLQPSGAFSSDINDQEALTKEAIVLSMMENLDSMRKG